MGYVRLQNTYIDLDDVIYIETNEGNEPSKLDPNGIYTDYTLTVTLTLAGGIIVPFTFPSGSYGPSYAWPIIKKALGIDDAPSAMPQ